VPRLLLNERSRVHHGVLDLCHVADQFFNGIDDVPDGSDTFELIRFNSFLGDFLQPHNQVDGINAIEVRSS